MKVIQDLGRKTHHHYYYQYYRVQCAIQHDVFVILSPKQQYLVVFSDSRVSYTGWENFIQEFVCHSS